VTTPIPTKAAIHAQVRETVARLSRKALEAVHPDARLEENLDLDSVKVMSLIFGLETHFAVRLPDRPVAELKTVGELVTLICSQLGATD
jgi:acyl carrier protein